MADDQIIDFNQAAKKHQHKRVNDEKDAKFDEMRARFEKVLPNKATPVKDYLKKKRDRKAGKQ